MFLCVLECIPLLIWVLILIKFPLQLNYSLTVLLATAHTVTVGIRIGSQSILIAGCTLIVLSYPWTSCKTKQNKKQNKTTKMRNVEFQMALCNLPRLKIQLLFKSFIDLLDQVCFPSNAAAAGEETGLTASEQQSINKGRLWERRGRQIVFFWVDLLLFCHTLWFYQAGFWCITVGPKYSLCMPHRPPQYADIGRFTFTASLCSSLPWNVNKVSCCLGMQW